MKFKDIHELVREILLLGCNRFISHFNLWTILMSKWKLWSPFQFFHTMLPRPYSLNLYGPIDLLDSELFPNYLFKSVYSKICGPPKSTTDTKGLNDHFNSKLQYLNSVVQNSSNGTIEVCIPQIWHEASDWEQPIAYFDGKVGHTFPPKYHSKT